MLLRSRGSIAANGCELAKLGKPPSTAPVIPAEFQPFATTSWPFSDGKWSYSPTIHLPWSGLSTEIPCRVEILMAPTLKNKEIIDVYKDMADLCYDSREKDSL